MDRSDIAKEMEKLSDESKKDIWNMLCGLPHDLSGMTLDELKAHIFLNREDKIDKLNVAQNNKMYAGLLFNNPDLLGFGAYMFLCGINDVIDRFRSMPPDQLFQLCGKNVDPKYKNLCAGALCTLTKWPVSSDSQSWSTKAVDSIKKNVFSDEKLFEQYFDLWFPEIITHINEKKDGVINRIGECLNTNLDNYASVSLVSVAPTPETAHHKAEAATADVKVDGFYKQLFVVGLGETKTLNPYKTPNGEYLKLINSQGDLLLSSVMPNNDKSNEFINGFNETRLVSFSTINDHAGLLNLCIEDRLKAAQKAQKEKQKQNQ